MKMSDTRQIAASPEEVYAALLDPDMLIKCVPGATEVIGSPEDGYEATVVQKVGPVKATFKGQVTMSDMVPGQSIKISGEGKGGAAGFAKGEADVTLVPKDGGTELTYDVEAKVGGKLAQLGSRIIDGFAKKMADQFFNNLQETLEGPGDAGAANGEEVAADAPKKKGWFGREKS
ncbi:MAG: carbon monoxide dehydrogenase subunit G [Sulfitobacter sp.]|jgi:carbon monoxide dehydrogenase subunit G|nr:carbon monoxide dehydrogenase subunit G [Sulfitobacter sp.]